MDAIYLFSSFFLQKFNHYDKCILLLTSWRVRINSIHKNWEKILNNIYKPKKIIFIFIY